MNIGYAIKSQLNTFSETVKLLVKPNYVVYFLPAFIVTLFFLGVGWIGQSIFGVSSPSEEGMNWFYKSFSFIRSVISEIFHQVYIFVILTVLSPFNTILSEKVAAFLTNKSYQFSLMKTINDFFRMVYIVIYSLILQLLFLVAIWILFKLFNLIDSPIYALVNKLISAFFIGFSFYDYSLERQGLSVKNSFNFAFSNITLVIFTGVVFYIFYYFPYFWEVSFIGLIIAPVFTTVFATINFIKQYKN